jgi:hypothetical protein
MLQRNLFCLSRLDINKTKKNLFRPISKPELKLQGVKYIVRASSGRLRLISDGALLKPIGNEQTGRLKSNLWSHFLFRTTLPFTKNKNPAGSFRWAQAYFASGSVLVSSTPEIRQYETSPAIHKW